MGKKAKSLIAVKDENVPYRWKGRIEEGSLFLHNGKFYFNESELDRYAQAQKITPEQYNHGDSYRNDFKNGGILIFARSSMGKERLDGSTAQDIEERVAHSMDSATRWRKANDGLPNDLLRNVLLDICCFGCTVKEFEQSEDLRQNSGMGMLTLRIALDCLGMQYRKMYEERKKDGDK